MGYPACHAQKSLAKTVQLALLTNAFHALMGSWSMVNVARVHKVHILEVVNVRPVLHNADPATIKHPVLPVRAITTWSRTIV